MTPPERKQEARRSQESADAEALPSRSRGEQPRLQIVPLWKDQAKAYIGRVHRHHPPSLSAVFVLGVADEEGNLRGAAQVGRPVARAEDTGPDDPVRPLTLEVTRVATDGCPNACSALYAAAWRVARALGWHRVITRNLERESGASLRAAGYRIIGQTDPKSWEKASKARQRIDTYSAVDERKMIWEAS